MTATASITWDADDRRVQAAHNRMVKQLADMKEEMRKLKQESVDTANSWARGLENVRSQNDKWASGLKNISKTNEAARLEQNRSLLEGINLTSRLQNASMAMSTGFVAAAGSAMLVTNELREQARLHQQISEKQLGASGTQRGFLRNLGLVSPAERSSALQRIERISDTRNVTQADLFAAAGTAMSARGGLSVDQAMNAVDLAARVAPENVGELTAVSGGLLDMASLTGSPDAKQNLGLLVAMGQQARATSLEKVSRHMVPGAIGVKGFGGNANDAAALVTTLSQAMKDPSGEMTATSAVSLAQQLAEAMPGQPDTASRIRAIQNDPSLRDRFMDRTSFERKAFIPIRDILTAGTETARTFEQFSAGMPTAETAAAMAEQFAAGLDRPRLQQAAAQQRAFAQRAEAAALGDFESGDKSRIREGNEEFIQTVDPSIFGAQRIDRRFMRSVRRTIDDVMGRDPAGTEEMFISGMIQEQQNRRTGSNAAEVDRSVAILQQQLAELRGIRNANERRPNVDAHTE